MSRLHSCIAAPCLTLVLAGAVVLPLDAQDPAQTPIRVHVELTLVEATVKDKTGRVLGDLKQDDFRLLEDNAEQKITHFSRDQIPLAVALVVDLSGSIQPFLRPLRYATLSALKALKPEDQVALFTFSGDVERRLSLTRDKRAVGDIFENLTAGGGTNINDGVYVAAQYLARAAPAARRVILLVSDNVPSTRGTSPRDVTRSVLEADAAVYSIRVPGENPVGAAMTARLSGGLVSVRKLTEETGGEVFEVQQDGSLFLSFKAVIERLKTRYTLGYYPVNSASDGKFRTLDVQLSSAHGTKGNTYKVIAKRGYYARPSPAP
jgi:VWFA-related protein